MNKLEKRLNKLKIEKKLGLMTHVVVGYPSINITYKLVKLMVKEGADIIELQIPFSDPLADGPTIMKACEESLRKGTKVKDSFLLMEKSSKEINIPLLFMAYYNTVFKYGTEKFCRDAKKAGASGLIVPDCPIEEENNEHLIKYCLKYGLANIRVISPASTNERLIKNAKVACGFIYATARQGITGVGKSLNPEIVSYLNNLKKYFKLPIAVGFGISKKEDLKLIKPYADIAVVGSAIIDVVNKSNANNLEKNVESFMQGIQL